MKKIIKNNLFDDIPGSLQNEWFQTLFSNAHVKIERIVSKGHCSPPDFWYDQAWEEWVVLIKGRAGLRFEGDPEEMVLGPGDALLIPAGVRHRVSWTDDRAETVWLAVHAKGPARTEFQGAGAEPADR